eukprot:3672511-Rhodomonas_salina.1
MDGTPYMRRFEHAGYPPATLLRTCYAESGTDGGYAPPRPVLAKDMLLPGVLTLAMLLPVLRYAPATQSPVLTWDILVPPGRRSLRE